MVAIALFFYLLLPSIEKKGVEVNYEPETKLFLKVFCFKRDKKSRGAKTGEGAGVEGK